VVEPKQVKCTACGHAHAVETVENEQIPYVDGMRHDRVAAVAVPVVSCGNCKLRYTDFRAEQLRTDAVCRALDVPNPQEFAAYRSALGVTCSELDKLCSVRNGSCSAVEQGKVICNRHLAAAVRLQLQRVRSMQHGNPEHDFEVRAKELMRGDSSYWAKVESAVALAGQKGVGVNLLNHEAAYLLAWAKLARARAESLFGVEAVQQPIVEAVRPADKSSDLPANVYHHNGRLYNYPGLNQVGMHLARQFNNRCAEFPSLNELRARLRGQG
jgi:hypothetical protein